MTGSAKIAWIIAAVLSISAWPGGQAHGAAPKDALKYLQFSHESSINLREFDGASPGYTDTYRGTWIFDWRPPAVGVSGSRKVAVSMHYRTVLNDSLKKIAQTSLDSRQDYYKVNLSLKGIKHLTLNYIYDRSDSFQNSFGKSSTTIQTTSLGLNAPRFPELSFGNSTTNSITGKGSTVSSATESLRTSYQVRYARNDGNFGQEYKYRYQVNSGSAKAEKKGSSLFTGYRQFKFDSFGMLQFDYIYGESGTYKDQGKARDLYNNNSYTLTYRNSVPAFPLSYNFRFASTNSSGPNSVGNTEIKSINLTYKAPVPAGKQLSVIFDRVLREDFKEPSTTPHKSEQLTTIQWVFRANPRTNGGIRYSNKENIDVLAGKPTSQNESVSGNLRYSIPGNQGELGALFGHISETGRGSRTSKDTFEFNNFFKLGDRANVKFFFTQNYSGSNAPRADTTVSGIHYRLSSGQNVSLDARWWQNMSRPSEFAKRSIQYLAVNFRYKPSRFLSYDFLVNSNGTSDTKNVNPNSQSYQSKNEIEFKVTYTF